MTRFLTGIGAAAAFVLVELLGRIVLGVPTLPEVVQDRLVLLMPGQVFAFMLEHLLYLGKPLFFGALLLAQLLLGGVVGLLVRGWRTAVIVSLAGWCLTGLLVSPLSGRGIFASDARLAAVMAAAFGAYALAVWSFRQGLPAPAVGGAVALDRRRLLAGGTLLAISAILARRTVGNLPSLPATTSSAQGSAEPDALGPSPPGLPPRITGPDAFYVVSKNLDDPVVDANAWQLQVAGLLDRPRTFTYQDVLALPAVETYRTLECISNEVGGDLMSTGRWTGVHLADVLGLVGVQDAAQTIVFRSVDGYSETMPLQKALDPSTLLVYQLDGQPLPTKHGYPLRVLGTGTYGMKNPKWLTQIQVVAQADAGFWEQQGWDPDAPVSTMARIDTPADGASVSAGPVTMGGVAFAADRGIQRVEVSTDGGGSWSDAQLLPVLGPSTWVFWQAPVQLTQPGAASLVARATDGTGQVQTNRRTDPFPQGANGWHTIQIHVTVSAAASQTSQ